MLGTFVSLYIILSICIGLWASKKVHNAKDFAVAGRKLPFPVVMATVFATWFGAESIFGVSSTFLKDGLGGISADPFGASLCLILAGFLFSKYLYRLNIMTLGDYYRLRFGKSVEVLATLCIVASYLGWVAAQTKALGILFSVLSNGAISEPEGMWLGTFIVLIYTVFGGMFSVAVLDFVQMIVMIGGLTFVAYTVGDKFGGGFIGIVQHASDAGKFSFFPAADLTLWLAFIGSFLTMMLGSLPQQDVFQRVTSANSAKTAFWGSLAGAALYFTITFVPMFIAYAATLVDPAGTAALLSESPEKIIPTAVMTHTGIFSQVLFYGAVLSAIMSTSSATLLAPAVAFSENVVRQAYPHMGDKSLLFCMRLVLVVFAGIVLVFALHSESSIFKMVENAYKITLAGAFAPLVGGILWRRASAQGAIFSSIGGLISWICLEIFVTTPTVPPQLIGLFVSIAFLIIGSLLPQWIGIHKHGPIEIPKPPHQ